MALPQRRIELEEPELAWVVVPGERPRGLPWLERPMHYLVSGRRGVWHRPSELRSPGFRMYSDDRIRPRREMALTVRLSPTRSVEARVLVCRCERLSEAAPARYSLACRFLWIDERDLRRLKPHLVHRD